MNSKFFIYRQCINICKVSGSNPRHYKKIINSKFCTRFCQTAFNLKITLELKKNKETKQL